MPKPNQPSAPRAVDTAPRFLVLLLGLLVLLLGLLALSAPARGEPVELSHDDGQPAHVLQSIAPGDIEAVRFTTAHPSTLLTLRLYFAQVAGDATVVVWADNGGNAPDDTRELWRGVVAPVAGDWTDVDISAAGLDYGPLQNIHVGHIVSDASTLLAWDDSGNDTTYSLARLDGEWYSISDGGDPPRSLDCLVRVVVDEHDRISVHEFTSLAEKMGGLDLYRVAWGDYDNDGDPDLLVNGSVLLRNEGDGTFTDVTEDAGLGGSRANGGVWADYDNDGWLDFYAARSNYQPLCDASAPCANDAYACVQGRCRPRPRCDVSTPCTTAGWTCSAAGRCEPPAVETEQEMDHDRLWRNNGDGTFTDVTLEAGSPYDYLPTEGAAWGDVDGDGFVDLYLANYEVPPSWTDGTLGVGTPDFLWQNNGDGTFTDISEEAGIHRPSAKCGRGVAIADYDADGWQDIYVSNYRLDRNFLWHNRGYGRFDMVSGLVGAGGVNVQGAYGHTIGSEWGDLDGDGDFDLFTANLAHPRFIEFSDKSMLYVNSGPPDWTFTDVREAAGITYYETHSDVALADYDNDGRLDLFITGIYKGYRSFLYRNLGNMTFAETTYEAGLFVDNGWGAAWADMDGDGDLDLAVRDGPFRNDAPRGNGLAIRLVGQTANRAAIGAVVRVTAAGHTQTRQVEGGKGTTTQNELTLHFGLGEATRADRVEILWPTWPPLTEQYENVPAGRTVTYVEGVGEVVDAGPTPDASHLSPPGGGGCGCRAGSAQTPLTLGGLFLCLGLWIRRRARRATARPPRPAPPRSAAAGA